MFWLEDVFVTGIVTKEMERLNPNLHIQFHDVKAVYFRHSSKKWRAKVMINSIKQRKGVLIGPVDSDATLLKAWTELVATLANGAVL